MRSIAPQKQNKNVSGWGFKPNSTLLLLLLLLLLLHN